VIKVGADDGDLVGGTSVGARVGDVVAAVGSGVGDNVAPG
jgi:hypothetical protein